jgi:hypothetical protein
MCARVHRYNGYSQSLKPFSFTVRKWYWFGFAQSTSNKRKCLCSDGTSTRVRKLTRVRSVAQYNRENRIRNQTERWTFESIEMLCWKKMLWVLWTEHRANETVLGVTDERKDKLETNKGSRWNTFGRMSRHERELIYRRENWRRQRPKRRPRLG